ncbi:hypothetical protein [Sedimentisphaera salicampi]|uniref:Uncharacterized protein n=1 Tax=Sedimentisphaera salicampi TaxID=1941349 RepID=A0A1W6LJE9_9BACT|nr:hypothetical protein [Sedimentisphaera salicampi]ARN55907.1 hypothetical protein STSP1_00274 [Sedimentisphaera salicampi]OXU16098.1 hypothetical protein SMSP1_00267 [Sedimentisphaera salicampi]
MKNHFIYKSILSRLILASLTGEITKGQLNKLNQILASSREAREYYRNFIFCFSCLEKGEITVDSSASAKLSG